MRKSFGMAAALCLILGMTAEDASANIVYNLSGVTLEFGGTVTGTFTTNDARTALISASLSVPTGAVDSPTQFYSFNAYNYTFGTAGANSTTDSPSVLPNSLSLISNTPTRTYNLTLVFSGGLSATGATIAIGRPSAETQVSMSGLVPTGVGTRNVTGGSVVAAAVPEPASISLVSLAMVGVILRARRTSGGRHRVR